MKILSQLFILLLIIFCSGCYTYVEPGEVGIKVHLQGSQKGVKDFPLQTGRIWYNPMYEIVYQYPTYMQNIVWTQSNTEGSQNDDAITFNSSEGATISADIGLNYTLIAERVPNMYVKHRQPLEDVTRTYMRTQARDAFNRFAGQYKAVEIFSGKKQELLDDVKNHLNNKLGADGFNIESISFIGSPRADNRVMESINSVIEATQRAIEAENKVRQIEAEAQQKIAAAKGEGESILTVANAQADANKTLSLSITPELIRYKMLEKWDGVMPKVTSGEAGISLLVTE